VRYDNSDLILGEHGLENVLKKEPDRATLNEFTTQFSITKQECKIMVIEPKIKLDKRNMALDPMFHYGEYLIIGTNSSPNYWAHIETNDSWKEHYFKPRAERLDFKDFMANNY
jgi:hypothetical protein